MYEKVKKFREFVSKGSTQLIIASISIAIFMLFWVCTDTNSFLELFRYPVEAYQSLEKEADTLVESNSFETNYDLVITNYDFNDNTLLMELSSNSSTKLNIEITNYGRSNQEYSRSREYNSSTSYVLNNVVSLISLCIFIACCVVLFILILATILQFITFIIHKVVKVIKNRKTK